MNMQFSKAYSLVEKKKKQDAKQHILLCKNKQKSICSLSFREKF